jgi:hypothetical protein
MKKDEEVETYSRDQINVCVMCSLLMDLLKVYSLVHLLNIAERLNDFHYFHRHLQATWWGVGSALILVASCESKEAEVRGRGSRK